MNEKVVPACGDRHQAPDENPLPQTFLHSAGGFQLVPDVYHHLRVLLFFIMVLCPKSLLTYFTVTQSLFNESS